MADTFFDFDTTINHDDHFDDLDCIETEEEEYDALNNETFGLLEEGGSLDDWEQQHEQLAEIAETSKHSEQLENAITQFVLGDDDDFPKENTWTYKENSRNGDIFNSPLTIQRPTSYNDARSPSNNSNQQLPIGSMPKKICTVEELERGLMTTTSTPRPQKQHTNFPPPQQQQQPIHHPLYPQMPRLPPGLHPMNMPGGPMPPIPGLNVPPGVFRQMNHHPYPPGLGPHNGPPMHPAHRMMQHPNAGFPVNHPYNFPPPNQLPMPPRNMQNMPPNHPQNMLGRPGPHQQQQHMMRNMGPPGHQRRPMEQGGPRPGEIRDEYAGLMSNREKQWLLNIQLLQLNTGTPYFDDYYFTVYKMRSPKTANKEAALHQQLLDKNHRHNHHQNNNNRRNNDRQDGSSAPLQSRVYTPLQFENSLGKLQCGSVTAPRKIIDTDVVTMERDQETPAPPRDTRKTKQLLLELEALYGLLLKMEDLRNPLAISNVEKLRELKQKQRLRELEAAPTPEQKQEVLKLLQRESVPVEENPNDYLAKLVNGLIQEEKYTSFFNIRKGKALLLRLLPHLPVEIFGRQLLDLWLKVLLAVPVVGRRDSMGDNMLPKLHPFFKRFVQTCKMSDVLDVVTNISEPIRQENNSRSTPLSHQGKAPLHFIIGNKFGISTIATMIVRCEYLISSGNATEPQTSEWSRFLVTLTEVMSNASNVATPMELVPRQIFAKHCNRIANLSGDRRVALEAKLSDCN